MKKRALVTGGTRGIGAAIARTLLTEGCEVFVSGTSPDGKAPDGCEYLQADFADEASLAAFAARVTALELTVLVNNAGINKVGPVVSYETDDFKRIQQVNVVGPFAVCRAIVPGMCERGFGRIVNITSVFGVVSRAGRSAYSTSKFGLLGLTRALALEVAKHNVLVNAVAPGFVDTELTRRVLGEDGIRDTVATVPIGRMARPEEIAEYVRFFVSERNTYMTGQLVVVDGGFTVA